MLDDPTQYSAYLLITTSDAVEYARCQAKHAAAVAAYNTARQAAIETNRSK